MNYKEALEYMASVNVYGSVLGLENITELLRRLDNPQDKLSFVHIAGTNGKGSVGAYLASILCCAGYCVGRYISPTVFAYREKIQLMRAVNSQNAQMQNKDVSVEYISEESTAKHLTTIKAVIAGMTSEGLSHPTPFEIETAMAFLEFVEAGCEIVVLEAGMGGRLDATNVISTTKCAVLTSIRMDHMSFLGDTLEKIAAEKAGIIKRGIRVVSYEQKPEAEQVIRSKVKEENAQLSVVSFSNISKEQYSLERTSFCCQTKQMGELYLTTSLLGENQPKNAALAIEAALSLNEIGYAVTKEHIVEGIRAARWRGRLEIVGRHPLVFVDGAHNYDAALSLRKSMEIYFKDKTIFAVVGMFADKECDKVLSVTLPLAKAVFTIRPDNKRAMDSACLAVYAKKYCSDVTDAKTIQKALPLAKERAGEDAVILCFGSLSFLHEVYEWASLQ